MVSAAAPPRPKAWRRKGVVALALALLAVLVFCPSCGGRRMTEHATQLVEAVLPRVPVRQWVLTLPCRWTAGDQAGAGVARWDDPSCVGAS